MIKAADLTDNGVGLMYISGPKLIRLAGKYRSLVPVLRELVLRPDTPSSLTSRTESPARSTTRRAVSRPFSG